MIASVVIPVLNQRPEILLEAVVSGLQQSAPTEVIVVDDGSEPAVAGLPDGVRLIRHEQNRGISAALNTGIAAASAPWICWVSSDDVIYPDKVKIQRESMDAAGALASCHAYYQLMPDGTVGLSYTPTYPDRAAQRRTLNRACTVNGSTTMIHRRVFDEVGLYDESYRYGQDWEMWCRIGTRYLWHVVPCSCTEAVRPACERCHGRGVLPLGARREWDNTTSAIARDPEKTRIRDEEDMRIRLQYRRRA